MVVKNARGPLHIEVRITEEGGEYVARALGHPVASQGDTIDEAFLMLRDAVSLYYDMPESDVELSPEKKPSMSYGP